MVGTGQLSESQMHSGASALAKAWEGNCFSYSCNESPYQILNSLPKDNGLVYLNGDAAMHNPLWGSWIEALGAWKQPTILISSPLNSGEVPGTSAAYVALCNSLSVPLLGIVQLGGIWEPDKRRSDGLPWCGWIPETGIGEGSSSNSIFSNELFELEQLSIKIHKRLDFLFE